MECLEMKIDTQALDEIVRKISAAIPDDLKATKLSVEKNARVAAEGVFQRLNLVTREEFDIQVKMLSKSQQRVKELEQRIQELEQKVLNK
jgi:BMFP domain-containing protein YqiC